MSQFWIGYLAGGGVYAVLFGALKLGEWLATREQVRA